ncbi:Fe2+-dependent dioxygenase [Xylophilus sp.]|uniref:Fe2+-dependent dioxygenase n=1 Tax=Xylophilus sp. TaxID=2653893 RepID=UPI0013B74F4B|nr:Fe2+-dependent dioxygenase [Xylophilus sp.]KAF1050219.1 MAG: PKHD-type hydroxylase [Xylophilus sp.]
MLIEIPEVFTAAEAAGMARRLDAAPWVDGKATAGAQSAPDKRNRQLPEDHPLARELGERIVERLTHNAVFVAAGLPKTIFPPLFNRYEGGEAFDYHIDNAVRIVRSRGQRVRTDLSATLFLSEPDTYDGGELVVEDTYGPRSAKLAAGHLLLYPGTSMHKVNPVTRGVRLASFFWIESLVREDSQRTLLLDMDVAIQQLTQTGADRRSLIRLTGVYHNLLRRWADM